MRIANGIAPALLLAIRPPHGHFFNRVQWCNYRSTTKSSRAADAFLGVVPQPDGRFLARAHISKVGVPILLGLSESPEQAARARDAAVAFLASSFSVKAAVNLNFPPAAPLTWPDGLPHPTELPVVRLRQELKAAVWAAGLLPPPPRKRTPAGDWAPRHGDVIGVHPPAPRFRADGSCARLCQAQFVLARRVINLGSFSSTHAAALCYDLFARVVAALGLPRPLNFPLDASLDAAAAAALRSLPLPAEELRATLLLRPKPADPASQSQSQLKDRVAALKLIARALVVPGRHFREKTSRFRGVSKKAGARTWRARIGSRLIGIYATEEAAARAYDAASVAQGNVQRLNFPEEHTGTSGAGASAAVARKDSPVVVAAEGIGRAESGVLVAGGGRLTADPT